MAYEDILNGGFDFDPAAERVRISFGKAKRMFTELYDKLPLTFGVGEASYVLQVNATGDAFELVPLAGGGDMLRANNLSDLVNVATARTNLGLGTAAVEAITAFATAAQGAKADSAVQSLGVVAGKGLSIDATDPQNLILDLVEDSIYVSAVTIDPNTKIITFTRENETDLTLDLSPYLSDRIFIDGFEVKKGVGVNVLAIEIGDYLTGWDGDRWVAFRVDGLPYTTESNRAYAVNGNIF